MRSRFQHYEKAERKERKVHLRMSERDNSNSLRVDYDVLKDKLFGICSNQLLHRKHLLFLKMFVVFCFYFFKWKQKLKTKQQNQETMTTATKNAIPPPPPFFFFPFFSFNQIKSLLLSILKSSFFRAPVLSIKLYQMRTDSDSLFSSVVYERAMQLWTTVHNWVCDTQKITCTWSFSLLEQWYFLQFLSQKEK